jgi:DNA-binding transcriptional LysR family regulator
MSRLVSGRKLGMNINQLRFAVAVAQTSSFTQAAEQCNVTQPTLSNSVAQLEVSLGAVLFARTTRKVTLTSFGKSILPLFEHVLAGICAIEETSAAHLRGRAAINIGLSPIVDLPRIATLLGPFQKSNPNIELTFGQCFIDDLERRLECRDIDIVLWPATKDQSRRPHAVLYSEELMFLPGTGSTALPNIGKLTISNVAHEIFVPAADLCGLRRLTRKIFVEARQEINEYPGEAVSYEAMQHCVEIGAGAALLPRSKVADGFRSKARVLHADNGDIIRMDVIATWNAVQEPTGPLASLLSYLVTLDTPGSGLFVAPGGVTQAG